MTTISPLVRNPKPARKMFATQNQTPSNDSDQTTSNDGGKYFDSRSEIHEVYWIAVDANRRNGPVILQNPNLHTKETDSGVSGVVDDYRFFQEQKKELIEEITGDLDMYGLRKYREDFPEPDEDMWVEAGSEHYGIPIAGIHKIPADEAKERFDVDYSTEGVDPIYVPILDVDGEEVVYDAKEFYEGEEPESESESDTSATDKGTGNEGEGMAHPDFPTDPATAMEFFEEQEWDSMNLQQKSTLLKLRDPTKSNRDIAAELDCSKNTVRKGLKKHLGDDGYDAVKERGKELRADGDAKDAGTNTEDAEAYMSKMGSDDGDDDNPDEEVVTVPKEEFEELKARVERLEAMFNLDAIEQ